MLDLFSTMMWYFNRRIRITSFLLLLTSYPLACAPNTIYDTRSTLPTFLFDYDLCWSDEFNGVELDASKWGYRDPGKRGDAIETKEAVSVSDGVLSINTHTDENGIHKTGMIGTQDRFMQKQGYWEARIKFDDRPGMHSAFWLQSPTIGKPIDSPKKAGVEIDIVEHRKHDGNGIDIESILEMALHWDGYGDHHQSVGSIVDEKQLQNGKWNTYGVLWDDNRYNFYFNRNKIWTYEGEAISNRSQYIIFSSEVKNNSWAGIIPKDGYICDNEAKMQVDYVRVYLQNINETSSCLEYNRQTISSQ